MTEAEITKAVGEIWELFRENARETQEVRELFRENARESQEVRELFRETDLRFKETGRELRELFQETDRKSRKTDRKIKELGKQIGGLGDKFGGFTEGMAFPSMKKILMGKFGAECVSARVLVRKNGDEFETDVIGWSPESVWVVEVKSNLKNKHVDKMTDNLGRFYEFFPEHRGKELYGIMAAVDTNEYTRKKTLDAGLYLAVIRDETFSLRVPPGFRPRRFGSEAG